MEEQEIRVRIPRKGEVLGIVESLLGGSRMSTRCEDGKMRICRVPGRFRKKLWIKEGNVVIVQPWPIQGEKSGDIIWRYTPTQANWLRKKGILKL